MGKYLFIICITLLSMGILGGCIFRSDPVCSPSPDKVVHVSFDDVAAPLKELCANRLAYTSLFECGFFRELKMLHDKYGAKFSLYVFEKDHDFDICEVPSKFRSEFRENADWLRFGFHAAGPVLDRNMSVHDFSVSYNNVRDAVYHFADTVSFCSVIRLHNYWASDSIVLFLRDHGGISGLLGADDGRDSYGLDSTGNALLRRYSFVHREGINYFKTDLRYEKVWFIERQLACLQNRDTLVIFTHEWAVSPRSMRDCLYRLVHNGEMRANWRNLKKLEKSVAWLKERGYEFSFLE